MKIGFIGLGAMGGAMAANLLRAGHEVTVWNRSPEKADALVAAGAVRADLPADAARGELVMTMLADDSAVEAVVFGNGGILTAGGDAIHISHSTISPALVDRLAAEHGRTGAGFISAPVFGRPAAAEAAKLFVVAGGAAALIERCSPALVAIGQRVFHVGETPSAANLVKLCGNFMIMAAVEAMGEAMTLAEKGGVSRSTLLEVLTGTLFAAPVYQTYGDILANDRFRPAGFTAPLGLKDMTLAADAAAASRTPMPLLSLVRDHLLAAMALEGDDIDWSAVALASRRAAGL